MMALRLSGSTGDLGVDPIAAVRICRPPMEAIRGSTGDDGSRNVRGGHWCRPAAVRYVPIDRARRSLSAGRPASGIEDARAGAEERTPGCVPPNTIPDRGTCSETPNSAQIRRVIVQGATPGPRAPGSDTDLVDRSTVASVGRRSLGSRMVELHLTRELFVSGARRSKARPQVMGNAG